MMKAGKLGSGAGALRAGGKQTVGGGKAPQLDLLTRFPDSPPPRLHLLDERNRGTRFIELPVRSVLNNPAATKMGFWSINPYVGCEFGCTYCYARDTHKWVMERADGRTGGQALRPPDRLPAWEAFEKEILVKSEVAEVLAHTINPARVAGQSLVIGTATDPYQPAERKFRLTRRILEVLRSYHGLSIEIITKSQLVTRDIDLLRAISEHNEMSVNISLATADSRLARRLEL